MKYPKLLGVLLMLAVILSACASTATPTNAPIDTISPATLEPSGTGTAGIPSTGGGTGTPTGSSSGGMTGTGTPSTGSSTAAVPGTGAGCDTVTVQLNSAAGSTSTGGMGSGTTISGTATPSTGTGTTGTATSSGTTASATDDFLVNCNGMALYINMDDTPNSGASSCNDDCATEWMPLTIGEGETPMAGEGVDESLLSTIRRDDGKTQVTYNGWPLYLYSGDSMAGDQNGFGIGDKWYLIDADGNPIQQ